MKHIIEYDQPIAYSTNALMPVLLHPRKSVHLASLVPVLGDALIQGIQGGLVDLDAVGPPVAVCLDKDLLHIGGTDVGGAAGAEMAAYSILHFPNGADLALLFR